MNYLIKYIFLILTITVNNSSYPQEQNDLKTIRIELKNSIGENIENAKVLIDSAEIKYDTLTKTYFSMGKFSPNFNVKVSCDGYEDLTYNRMNIPYSPYNSTDFVAKLYLSKPGDKYYYYTPHFRVPYHPRPDELLVVLKTNENIISEKSISEFENVIKEQGLILDKTFLESPSQNSIEYMKYRSVAPSIRRKVIVKKEDGSAFDSDFCPELAFIRQLEQVAYAGPLILMNNSYYDAFTYNHYIKLDYPLKNTDGETLNNLLKGIDERYFFDEKNYRIVLPPETNENVPQIMEKIYDSGISEPLYTSVMKFKQTNHIGLIKNTVGDSNPISQLNDFDTLKNESLIFGGKEVQYQKEWDRIGIVFESDFTDYLSFITKYNLEIDKQLRDFTVFRLTKSLSLEKRKILMESIKEEKFIKIVGDLLFESIITEQIIVRWKRSITDSERINIFLKEEGLEEISKQEFLNITILKAQSPYNYRVVDVCNKLMKSGLVTFAEPDLYFSIELD